MSFSIADRAARILKPRKEMVIWTAAEIETLGRLVWSMRRKRPQDSLVSLVNRAQEQLPAARRRVIAGSNQIEPLLEWIRNRETDLEAAAERAERLQQRLDAAASAPTTPAEWLAGLSDDAYRADVLPRALSLATVDDVLAAFKPAELLDGMPAAELIGYAAERAYADLVAALGARPQAAAVAVQPAAAVNGSHNGNGRNPTIVVIGTKGMQATVLRERLPNVTLLCLEADKLQRESLPTSAAACVLLTRFVSHQHQTIAKAVYGERLHLHAGGFERLADVITRIVKR